MRAYVLRLDGLGISHKAGKVRVLRTNGLGLAWSGTHLLLPPGGASRLLVKRCHGDGHDCLSLTPHTQGNMAATRLARLRPRQRAHPYPCSLPCALPASHAMPCPVPLLDSPCPPPFERSSIDGRLGQAQKERNRQVLGADRLLLLLPVAPLSPSMPMPRAAAGPRFEWLQRNSLATRDAMRMHQGRSGPSVLKCSAARTNVRW